MARWKAMRTTSDSSGGRRMGSRSMCRGIVCYESPPDVRITLARRGIALHPLDVTRRGDPGGLYEEEGQSFDPGFLAKASKLADGTVESAAADARSRGTAVSDRQAALDVIEVGSPRIVVPRRRFAAVAPRSLNVSTNRISRLSRELDVRPSSASASCRPSARKSVATHRGSHIPSE
jgi:hypothetical protein